MSLSKKERLENMDIALRMMMDELGGRAFDEQVFEPEDTLFKDIYPTTWKSLEDQNVVKPLYTIGHTSYELTPWGWRKGIELTGQLDEVKKKAGQVLAAAKQEVQGRHQEVFVYSDVIATRAGVTAAFIVNIVESDFITRDLGRKSFSAERQIPGYLLRIPIDFGLELL